MVATTSSLTPANLPPTAHGVSSALATAAIRAVAHAAAVKAAAAKAAAVKAATAAAKAKYDTNHSAPTETGPWEGYNFPPRFSSVASPPATSTSTTELFDEEMTTPVSVGASYVCALCVQ